MVELAGISRSPRTLKGDVPDLFQALGDAASLPATLDNGLIRLTFVAHAAHGVTLDRITHLVDDGRGTGPFDWVNAQTSTDGIVTGKLWQLVANPPSDWDPADWGEEDWGGGYLGINPPTAVTVTSTQDETGRPALCFRWAGVGLPTEGSVDVTVIVSLGAGDLSARWRGHVARHGDGTDVLRWLDCPRLAFIGPVPARSGATHRESQARARLVIPAVDVPPILGTENTPLTSWEGQSLLTYHPEGSPGQPMQWEALAALDPQDVGSIGRMLFLGADDAGAREKRFARAGRLAGSTLIYDWAHRYVISGDDLSARYSVHVGCLEAHNRAAWWQKAAAFYRDEIVAPGSLHPPPKAVDDGRGELARAEPLATSIGPTPFDAAVTAGMVSRWSGELQGLADASAITVQDDDSGSTTAPDPFDHATTRGANYLPMASRSHNLHLAWLPKSRLAADWASPDGFFWPPHAGAELDVLAGVGFNAVRIWGSFLGWLADRAGYMATLKSFAQMFRARGLRMLYVLFNAVPAGYGTVPGTSARFLNELSNFDPSTLRTNLWTLSDLWQTLYASGAPTGVPANEVDATHFPEPLTALEWEAQGAFGSWTDTRTQASVTQYVHDVATFFASDPDGVAVYVGTDLANEANVWLNYYTQRSAPTMAQSERDSRNATIKGHVFAFLAKVYAVMRSIHPGLQATIGWAGSVASSGLRYNEDLLALGVQQTFLSAHAYTFKSDPTERAAAFAAIAANLVATKGIAQAMPAPGPAASAGVPVVLSEFFVTPEENGAIQGYLDAIAAVGGGGYVWCYIQNNAYRNGGVPFDGLATCHTPALLLTTHVGADDDWDPNDWDSNDWAGEPFQFDMVLPADDASLRAWVLT